MIRDSDGTRLFQEIIRAGYRIYSTICIIRQHNAFALAHPEAQQQTFLGSRPVVAAGETVKIPLLAGYFTQQFALNETPEALALMQVWDRTIEEEVPRARWSYQNRVVQVARCVPGRCYTANFLCYRVWKEINMYNHTTNHWQSEHLRQLDPRYPLAWGYLTE